jgi:hypothetical protein
MFGIPNGTESAKGRQLARTFNVENERIKRQSRISYSDAEYFNLNAKDARVAHAERAAPYPSLEQCRHAFR